MAAGERVKRGASDFTLVDPEVPFLERTSKLACWAGCHIWSGEEQTGLIIVIGSPLKPDSEKADHKAHRRLK